MRPKTSVPGAVVFSFFLLLAACLSAQLSAAQESSGKVEEKIIASHLLDGKEFIGPTGEKGKKADHEDVLRFSDGKFTSSACFEFGFKGGPYTTTHEGETIHFHAVTISPTHGKMEWNGTLKGDSLEVNYSWTKERWFWTTYREYWFKGMLKK